MSKLKSEIAGKAITRQNLEAATLKTFTGKWAKSKGYGKPEFYNSKGKLNEIEGL